MPRLFICALLSVWLPITATAFDAVGTIKKIDADEGVIHIFANGQDRSVKAAKDVKVYDAGGKELKEGLKARELKDGVEVTVTVERGDGRPVITAIRLGKKSPAGGATEGGKSSVGFKPLNDMTATDKYKGEDGGLYGGGKNEPPEAHQKAAAKETARIIPLDADGNPANEGTIALISISMSNATQEFSFFKQVADRDKDKSRLVTIVDCAQGGQAMAEWVDAKGGPWSEAERRLRAARVSPKQVQVAWIKLANKGPSGDLQQHGKKLQKDTLAVLHNAKDRFPNLRIVYLGSRIYGGYATSRLNPEPYAYESAFAVRWLIQDQIKGDAELNFDAARGAVKAPLLLWGPYFWADGITPRKSDGLIWERSDLAGDGTHPSQTGRQKVSDQLLKFFKSDELARKWFVKP
jgi:hypothetical protein